jgi:sporulation protein YlmC with PRC-barrel domain
MQTTITRCYDHHTDAMKAAADVRNLGISSGDVSVVASNAEGWYRDDNDGDKAEGAAKGAGTGATIGAAAGGGAGLLAGLGMLAIPGLGPVIAAGWLASTAAAALAGAAAGGTVGGIIGALKESGVDDEDAHVYAENVRRGGSLVTVRTDDRRRSEVERILDRNNPVDPKSRGETYRARGWKGFDHSAPAFNATQVAEERKAYAGNRGTSSDALISADRVEGTEVYNGVGDHLGEVEDVIIDKQSGKVAYAVMSFGGFLGIGEKYHPVPWSMLKYDTTRDGYVVPLDKRQLDGAPSYSAGEMRFADRDWNTRIYDYYKVPPYWG